eukprot:9320382-Pyramimonas_sp.AAC.1
MQGHTLAAWRRWESLPRSRGARCRPLAADTVHCLFVAQCGACSIHPVRYSPQCVIYIARCAIYCNVQYTVYNCIHLYYADGRHQVLPRLVKDGAPLCTALLPRSLNGDTQYTTIYNAAAQHLNMHATI